MKEIFFCSSCDKKLTGNIKFYQIQGKEGVYHTCSPCLKKGLRKLKKLKNKTPEMIALINQLKQIFTIN